MNTRILPCYFMELQTLTLGASIAEDVGTKLLMVKEVKENTPPGEVIQSTFQYKDSEKYDAQVVRRK